MREKKTKDYFKIIKKIEKVRSKNNVNWMDVLRLGFRYSPDEARKLIKKINSQDKTISNLLKQLGKK